MKRTQLSLRAAIEKNAKTKKSASLLINIRRKRQNEEKAEKPLIKQLIDFLFQQKILKGFSFSLLDF